MAAATSNAYNLPNLPVFTPQYPPAASTNIYSGLPVCVDANGNLNPASDTTGLVFVGYSINAINNSSGSANGAGGTLFVNVQPPQSLGYIELGATSPVQYGANAWPGTLAYFLDNQTVCSAANNTSSHSILVGKIVAVSLTGAAGRVVIDVLNRTAG